MYDELESAILKDFKEFGNKIILVKNEHYIDYGSGYSLYLALLKIKDMDVDEVVFAEGDLYVDKENFVRVCDNSQNVITCNTEAIEAKSAVAFYFDRNYGIHYIYDTEHSYLEIKEPFLGIYNSGQIWKFANVSHFRRVMDALTENDWHGTNLVFIQKYFGSLKRCEYNIVTFDEWVNCNTVFDYKKCGMKGKENEDT